MRSMRGLLAAGIMLAASAAVAFAADAPSPRQNVPKGEVYVPYDWSGFIIGFNGGAGIGTNGASSNLASPLIPSNSAERMKGWLLGGQIGARKQVGSWVFGVRGDIDWSNITNDTSSCSTARRTFFTTQLADTTSCQSNGAKINYLSLVTGSVGVAVMERLLWQVEAGLAMGKVTWGNNQSVSTTTLSPTGVAFCANGAISCPSGAAASSDSAFKTGYTVGTSLEAAVTRNLSTELKYNYVRLGTVGGATGEQRVDAHILRAGFNYRFP